VEEPLCWVGGKCIGNVITIEDNVPTRDKFYQRFFLGNFSSRVKKLMHCGSENIFFKFSKRINFFKQAENFSKKNVDNIDQQISMSSVV